MVQPGGPCAPQALDPSLLSPGDTRQNGGFVRQH